MFAGVTDEQQSYRVAQSVGLNMQMGPVSMSLPLDMSEPILTAEVDSDGEQHLVFDFTSAFTTMMSSDEDTASFDLPDQVGMEMWTNSDELVIDTAGFGEMFADMGLDANGGTGYASLFAPGIFKVDLEQAGAAAGTDAQAMIAQIAGQSVVNPDDLLQPVADHFDDAEQIDGDPHHLRLTVPYSELAESADISSGPMTEMGQAAQDALNDTPIEITITTDDEGRLIAYTIDMDMSSFMTAYSETADTTSSGEPGMFDVGDITYETQVGGEITYDPSIDVQVPTDVTDDRTEAFVEALDMFGN